MEKLSKYLIFSRVGYLSAMDAMNEFHERGYVLYGQPECIPTKRGDSAPTWLFIMELKDRGYTDAVEVADAPEERANELLASGEGWKIASTSVSSKFYRMVKIVEPSNTDVQG